MFAMNALAQGQKSRAIEGSSVSRESPLQLSLPSSVVKGNPDISRIIYGISQRWEMEGYLICCCILSEEKEVEFENFFSGAKFPI